MEGMYLLEETGRSSRMRRIKTSRRRRRKKMSRHE
jgi:hypothetical protein